jgi:hypothetical protein
MRLKNHFALFCAVILLGRACPAQDSAPIVDPHPHHNLQNEPGAPEHGKLFTADASPLDPGQFEMEVIHLFSTATKTRNAHGGFERLGRTRRHDTTATLTAGVLKDVDVNLTAGFASLYQCAAGNSDCSADASDVNVGARWRFLNLEDKALEFAWIPSVTIPVARLAKIGDRPVSQNYFSLDQSLAITKDWGNWTANLELGVSLPAGGHRNDTLVTGIANAAIGYQVLCRVQPELEINASHTVSRGSRDDSQTLAATLGLVMPVNDRFRVNAGAQQMLLGRNADHATTFVLALKLAW